MIPADQKETLVELGGLGKELEGVLSDFVSLSSPSLLVPENGWRPNTDIFETKDELVIRIEIAGVRKEDIHLTLKDHILTLRGKRIDLGASGRVYYHQMEITYGVFERIIVLPKSIVDTEIRASYQEGFLEITIPKKNISREQSLTIRINE
ncbi:MAG: Hsp20/alpha crystallin family protein [candidate division KSB1 bacterium]|nr:Hsp20/alpha crystallin family protein [candidate division KSB1 bacterium]